MEAREWRPEGGGHKVEVRGGGRRPEAGGQRLEGLQWSLEADSCRPEAGDMDLEWMNRQTDGWKKSPSTAQTRNRQTKRPTEGQTIRLMYRSTVGPTDSRDLE